MEINRTGYEQRYERATAPLRRRPGLARALGAVNRGLVAVFYGAYAVLLGWALVTAPGKLLPLVGVVAVGFAAVSLFRKYRNASRPYEVCAITPLIARDGAGWSFPSRHAFSAFAIAASWFAASALVAIGLVLAACVLAICRVLGGVHFPRDVIVGAIFGTAIGFLAAALSFCL